jgi:hypothetical protein
MYKPRFLTFLAFLLFMLASCKTDFDITSEWKDITVVYGLIDQTDSVHLIKINKAFLGNGNALQYATVEDSSSYGDNLDVKIIEKRGDNVVRELIFDTTSVYHKDSGLFYYPHQVLYKYDSLLFRHSDSLIYQNYNYLLNIRNKISGSEISAKTPLIRDFSISKPRTDALSKIEFKRSVTAEQVFSWTSAVNGKRYQIAVRFYYKESSAPGDTVVRYAEWIQSPEKSDDASGGQPMTSSYYNEKFYTTCINQIPYADAAKEAAVDSRQVLYMDFIFTVIGDEMNTYLEVNEPSNSVLQDKPEYTNITNGIGIFSCRYTKKISRKKLGQLTEIDLIAVPNLKFIKNLDN